MKLLPRLASALILSGLAVARAQDDPLALPITPLEAEALSGLQTLPVDVAEPVKAIVFSGNKVTRDKVMLRELPFQRGQGVNAALVEKGRQAILDLGLFKSVTADITQESDGVTVTYTVAEKFYLLPLPRIEANSDGQYAYGAQLRWSNVFGLNHSFRAAILQRESGRAGIGTETQGFASYFAPFVNDTRWGVGLSGSYSTRAINSSLGSYDEDFASASVFASRFLSETTVSQGWFVGGGLLFERQDTSGIAAPFGKALSPVAAFGYRDLRFKIYSEEGVVFGTRAAFASQGLGSDYNYGILTTGATRFLPIGSTPHQTLHIIAEAGARWEGPRNTVAFGLGGASTLRGYEAGVREGDGFYRLGLELARPVIWPWLRAVAIAEVGDAVAQPSSIRDTDPLASVGLGFRMRFPAFVDFEIEAGIALPLSGGGGAKFFGGKV